MNTIFSTVQKTALILALLFSSTSAFSQLILSAEVRPRAEFRNGFKTLAPNTANPAFSIQQRTRFNLSYQRDKVTLFMTFQDVRTWGDVPQLNLSDQFGTTVHQAWGQYQISKAFAVRVGRQELIYDNHRFFGNVGWAQQARSHDLAMFKYTKNKLKVDLGVAYNQDGPRLESTTYNLAGNYKTMQYIWAHNDWDKLGVSLLFLNNGLQFIDAANADNNETRYSQTIGTYVTDKFGAIELAGTFYYQMGKDRSNNSLGAFLAGIDANWKPKDKKIFAGAGFEMQSGNDLNWKSTADSTNNKAFFPLYGTNHKFNGLMDYFYVGNHANSVGLVDLNATLGYKFKFKKSKIMATFHYFTSSGAMTVLNSTGTGWETRSSSLGSEIDIVYVLPLGKDANLKMGYSQMFASESMELIKSTGSFNNTNNWAWVMLTFKPQLFKHDYKKTTPVVE